MQDVGERVLDPTVEKVVRTIAENIRPNKIILFGSRAMGQSDPERDIDLVVVYDGYRTKREIQLAIHRLFEHPDFSLDVFVLSTEELDSQRRVANTLAREVSERGVVCYG
ncbi:nucleotidyltransferase domain-containing protein [Candidatus Poribacteria bacterium]|nr:nucleotidyltransferase domain-containing protein [Candidatus Poribacteria bacterium]